MARRLTRRRPSSRRSAPISRFKKFGILPRIKNIASLIKRRKWITLAVVVIIIVAAVFLWPKASKPTPTEVVKRAEFSQTISITGSVVADKSVDLTFPIGGTLVYVGVQKGNYVQQYQTIATLDQRTALKNLQNALLSYSLQRDTFDQTQANNLNRAPDQALNDTMKRILQDNQYNLDKAVVSVELQDLARQQSILTTPISGIVTRADAKNAGVTASSSIVFSVVDPNSLSFKMEVDEADVSRVRPGQKVKAVFDSYPNETVTLTIDSIDFVTHTTSTGGNAYDVKAKIPDNPNYKYRVGMNGNAEIILYEKSGDISVPLSSITEGNKVFVKTHNGFVKKTLKLGIQNDTSAEVISGLIPGEEIAIEPSSIPQGPTGLRIPFVGRFIRSTLRPGR